jgi:uncharacterized membrane protein (DUF4010 family)
MSLVDGDPGRLALAALIGLAVGIEREWSGHASGPRARFAGARTFLLLGLLGGIAGWLYAASATIMAVVLLAAGCGLAVVAYAAATRATHDTDGTTETAALLVLATGALAGGGQGAVASGIAAVMVVALAEKARVQRLVQQIEEKELQAGFHFAVLALVVLPLVPRGPYGPFGAIRPRELWAVVLVFSAINFLGYLAHRIVGADRGYGLGGLLGGLVSSTAVAFTFARRSRIEPEHGPALAVGIVAACTVLLARVGIVMTALNPTVARHAIPYLLVPALVGGAAIVYIAVRRPHKAVTSIADRNPLRLGSAIRMAIAFQAMLLILPLAQRAWGSGGLLGSAALLGLTDMDALTYSLARPPGGGVAPALAARALGVGIFANTLFKLVLVLTQGDRSVRRIAGLGLASLAAASGLSLALL